MNNTTSTQAAPLSLQRAYHRIQKPRKAAHKTIQFTMATLAFMMLPLMAHAEIYSNYIRGNNYGAFVNGMPDLDQRRDTPVWSDESSKWSDEDRDGGRMYCGPTSGANVLSYLAQEGYEGVEVSAIDVEPIDTHGMRGAELFLAKMANDFKRLFADQLIEDTADAMDTDTAKGTGGRGLRDGLQEMLSDDYDVNWYGNKECQEVNSETTINPRRIFDEIDDGNLVIMRYAYYNTDTTTGVTERHGSHWVAVTGVMRSGGTRKVWYRDSNRDHGVTLDGDPDTQSEFVTEMSNVVRGSVTTEGPEGCTRTRWELIDLQSQSGSVTRHKYIEDIVVVSPPEA
jgi:hypothetical protein